MSDYEGPVIDDHLHLDADNRGIEAVRAFERLAAVVQRSCRS